MTDDLANQLRQRASKQLAATPVSLLEKGADRIEELETTFQMYVDANEARIEAEEKLARLKAALALAKEMYETSMLTAGGSPEAWGAYVKARNAFAEAIKDTPHD